MRAFLLVLALILTPAAAPATPAVAAPAVAAPAVAAAAPAEAAAAPPVTAAAAPVGSDTAMYPRVVRLADGRALLSVTQFPPGGPVGGIYENSGNGFQRVGTVADPEARAGLCCATLFVLPRAIGGMPAGTVLWAGSVGQDGGSGRRMAIRVWASNDAGRNWRFLSTVARSDNAGGLWEPEFFVDAYGRLVVHFADESQPGRSQVLVQAISNDGVGWSARTPIVTGPQAGHRPGMPAVRRLADGRYLLAYEICGFGGQYDCAVRSRLSGDGVSWGDPARLDPLVQTQDGRYLTATPTLAVTSTARVLLIGQRVRNADGTDAAVNGRAMFSGDGTGPWTAIPAPVAVPGARSVVCPNYSPSLAPSLDGNTVLQVSTDDTGAGCRAYGEEGLLPPMSERTGRFGAIGGTCVDVAAGGGFNGAAVQLWSCNNAPVQRWTLRTDGSIGAMGRCLDVPGAATAGGTKIQIWDCNGTPAQQWLRRTNGSLLNPNSGRCLDSPGGAIANGTRLQLWDCNGLPPQSFPYA
ncbi:ricin-type beta-trefoil lectin domain protein [Actinoplanes bogorensis]|uniref:Ricin-type beta-trefoil lectin domain protein n=1 Tax=Paractinoplanes bogorensis TaxID=1610840 RepID=A0ABS5Z1P3_9ACTN|nr:ricin-type beta-trefoil lectin domain protein [Actinoplanes bogorensis]MBU2669607.1 ricin-type beta-trefoil lectin domain protein [Actinoplanes bogorensis]